MANTIVVDILADTRSLVKGVNDTNAKLNTLNGTASKISSGFGFVTKALAGLAAAKFVWTWVTDFEAEQQSFAKLADLFGKDADNIATKIGNLSTQFKIDDGDIAQSLVTLANSTAIRYRGILDEIATLSLFAQNQDPNKDLNTLTSGWVKALKSGTKLDGADLAKLGLIGQLSQSELKQFQSLKTITEQVKYLYSVLQDDISTDLKFTTTQSLTYEFEKLKDTIAEVLLPILQIVTPVLQAFVSLITVKDPKTGETKLKDEVKDLAIALGLMWTVGKLSAFATALTTGEGALVGLKTAFKGFPALLEGITFAEIPAALGIAIETIWSKLSVFGKGFTIWLIANLGATTVRQLLKVLPTEWEKVGNAIIDGIMEPINHPVEAVIQRIKWAWTGLKNSMLEWAKSIFMINSPSKVFIEIGSAILEGIVVGFTNISGLIAKFKTSLSQIYTEAKLWITQLNWSSMGTAIINGLVAGMSAIASTPINFIKGLANNMVNTFKTFFKISSPSKVMAGYGRNLMEGLGLGITNNQGLAVAGMNMNLKPSFSGARGSANNYITINAGIGTDPYEVGRYVKSALDKYAGVNGR